MKKYLIYLMMAAAVVMLGASCSPDEDYEPEVPGIETPETPNDGENETPDEPENPEEPGDNPDTPSGNSKYWSLISVGAVRHSAWQRKLSARQEQTFSALSR